MARSSFDPEAFLGTETEDANETHYTPVPEDEYQAVIEKISVRQAKESTILNVQWDILDQDELAGKLGFKDGLKTTQSIFLDLEADGTLSGGPNKNVKLGQLREALGQNKAGKPWFPRQLEGAGPCTILVTERPDKDDAEIVYNDVKRVGAPA